MAGTPVATLECELGSTVDGRGQTHRKMNLWEIQNDFVQAVGMEQKQIPFCLSYDNAEFSGHLQQFAHTCNSIASTVSKPLLNSIFDIIKILTEIWSSVLKIFLTKV